jgi:hypothetical protein
VVVVVVHALRHFQYLCDVEEAGKTHWLTHRR